MNGCRSIYGPISNVDTGQLTALERDLIHDRQGKPQVYDFLHVLDTKRTDSDALQYPFFLSVAYSPPAFATGLGTTNGPVYQVQVDIAKPAFINRLLYCFSDVVIAIVQLKLGSVKYIRPWNACNFAEFQDSLPRFFFVLIPRSRVLADVRFFSENRTKGLQYDDTRPFDHN